MESVKIRLYSHEFSPIFYLGIVAYFFGAYMGGSLGFEGGQIGAIFATLGIASLFMPGVVGIVADKWVNASVSMIFVIWWEPVLYIGHRRFSHTI